MKRRWQNRVALSSLTLPTASVVATLLWWLPQGGYSLEYLTGWLTCVLTTYLLVETVAENALLRIRSRMISSLFLLLMAVCGFLHPLQTGTVAALALVLTVRCLFRTCEKPQPQVDTLHAYFVLALGSLLWPPLLLLVPVLLWCQGMFLRSLTWRSFGAAVIGLLLPYVHWAVAAFALGRMQPFVAHAAAIAAPVCEPFAWQWMVELAQALDWEGFRRASAIQLWDRSLSHLPEVAAAVLVVLVGLTGFVHYMRKSFDDKIRVRMCHYCFVTLEACLGLWLLLQPHHVRFLLPLLLVVAVPGAAHFVALTHTWWTNAWVVLLTFALVAVGVCTLAFPWYFGWTMPLGDIHLSNFSVHLPTLSFHLPTLSVHLPTLSVHLPILSFHLPTFSFHLPTLPVHLPTLPVHLSIFPVHAFPFLLP